LADKNFMLEAQRASPSVRNMGSALPSRRIANLVRADACNMTPHTKYISVSNPSIEVEAWSIRRSTSPKQKKIF